MRNRSTNNTSCRWIEKSILTLVCLVLPILATAQNSQIPAHEGDSLALVAFYNQNNGPNWTWQDNWLTGPVSSWQGILLSVPEGRVVELVNYSRNISGEFATELLTLSKLKVLSFSINDVTGPLPPEIGNLTELELISLRGGNFSGPIPKEIGSLTNLEFLELDNNLSGEIPLELTNLNKLQTLNLAGNDLSGPIPAELERLTELTTLNLASNRLSGPIPIELTRLPRMTNLILSRNQLTGSIPIELSQLSTLWNLSLANNQLKGPIPPELGNLPLLNSLDLSGNSLSGTIPAEIGDLFTLNILILSNNRLTGSIPVELANLTRLRHADLSYNSLSGAVPFDVASQFASIRHNTGRFPNGCHANANTGLCIPDTADYRAIGVNPICNLPLSSSCIVTTDAESEQPKANLDFNVFPNPVNDRIRIEVNQDNGLELTLYDVLGRQVHHVFVSPGSRGRIVDFNVDILPVGSYVLNVIADSDLLHSEIIVVSR